MSGLCVYLLVWGGTFCPTWWPNINKWSWKEHHGSNTEYNKSAKSQTVAVVYHLPTLKYYIFYQILQSYQPASKSVGWSAPSHSLFLVEQVALSSSYMQSSWVPFLPPSVSCHKRLSVPCSCGKRSAERLAAAARLSVTTGCLSWPLQR